MKRERVGGAVVAAGADGDSFVVVGPDLSFVRTTMMMLLMILTRLMLMRMVKCKGEEGTAWAIARSWVETDDDP